jgi:type I restriction enzyme, S subunit
MIPQGWQMLPLEKLALVERGKFTARPRNDPRYYGGSTPFVQTGDVTAANGILNSYSQTLNDKGLTVSKLFPRGSILITIAANIGEVAITEIDVACPDSIVVVQAEAHVCREWLRYAISTRKQAMDSEATQNAQKNINLQVLRPLQILTPPIAQQKKIAEILGTWDEAIGAIEKLIAAKQKLKESLLHFLTTKAEYRFKEYRLSELSDKAISYGIVQTGEFIEGGVSCVRVVDLTRREIRLEHMVTTTQEISQSYKKTILEEGELMIALRGEIGLVTLVSEKLAGCNLTRGVARISPNKNIVIPKYLLWAMRSTRCRNDLLQRVNGSALKEIPISELRKVLVPVPSLEHQKQISEVLSACDREIQVFHDLLTLFKAQKRGLMQKLLTGQWRVKTEE